MHKTEMAAVSALSVAVAVGAALLAQPRSLSAQVKPGGSCSNTHCFGTQSCNYFPGYACSIADNGQSCTITNCPPDGGE